MTASRRRAAGLALAGLAFLALGLLVYLADRPPLAARLPLHVPGVSGARWFGSAADWLPALAHTAGFGLLTAAVLPPRGRWALAGCVFWGLVNVLAEVGQLPRVDQLLAALLVDTLGDGRAVAFVAQYFTLGTFDPLDVAAAVAGTLVALLVLRAWPPPDSAVARPPVPPGH
jgi:hypothetical protein